MDIQIRTGDDLTCGYTGKPTSALVRIRPGDEQVDEGGGEYWTQWMGRSALEQAMRMLVVAEGPSQQSTEAIMPTTTAAAAPHYDRPQSPQRAKRINPPDLIKQFDRQFQRLLERGEREQDEKGQARGLTETDLRELVANFKDSFPNPTAAMLPILARNIGMTRERFEILLKTAEAIPTLLERGGDEED